MVHLGKSFTQPIPNRINMEAIELINKVVLIISFTFRYVTNQDIPNNKIGIIAKIDVLIEFVFFMLSYFWYV